MKLHLCVPPTARCVTAFCLFLWNCISCSAARTKKKTHIQTNTHTRACGEHARAAAPAGSVSRRLIAGGRRAHFCFHTTPLDDTHTDRDYQQGEEPTGNVSKRGRGLQKKALKCDGRNCVAKTNKHPPDNEVTQGKYWRRSFFWMECRNTVPSASFLK